MSAKRALKKQATNIAFATALMFSVAVMILVLFQPVYFLPLMVSSMGYNLWTLYYNEKRGFVKSKETRRAYEPRRKFSRTQAGVLLLIVFSQIIWTLLHVAL